ncbi:outer membrane lipoprotein carrier protein LolA [Polaribacter vadi]|uniref:LolA family protein n=1 Tax=Polaribacter TaxID=52959 RepID=UPI001C0A1190|nr:MULTISPECIES: outer membrane lipoprotein carrier protein LolA [Polaribacter]MBU3011793.1 outer membrane lipoprotein carrier protein LolA [Polaribacter vadi]MDO6741606.1 outer membrane lipoprotein carrier protein LolA [Polaribacter sp. 1_MG-2023]
MKKITILFLSLLITSLTFSQTSPKAKSLLDEVSSKMSAYNNMFLGFSQTLSNEEAGIKEGDEPPIRGEINLQGEKYNLNYLGNNFIYDGSKLYVINNDEKEISITDGDMSGDDGFIYPSKLLTFYKEGYNLEMGKLENINGRKIQFVTLNPIDSDSEIVKVELGIDEKTKHIYKLIQTGANGAKTSFIITTFKSNQNLSESFFKFDKQKYLSQKYTID